jgi:hypothetical protein
MAETAPYNARQLGELIAVATVHARWAHGLTEPQMPPEVTAAVHAGMRDAG